MKKIHIEVSVEKIKKLMESGLSPTEVKRYLTLLGGKTISTNDTLSEVTEQDLKDIMNES